LLQNYVIGRLTLVVRTADITSMTGSSEAMTKTLLVSHDSLRPAAANNLQLYFQ